MDTSHEELEDLWCRRLASAKLRLDVARNFMNEVQQATPVLDGEYAYALRAENVALAEFHRLLRLCTDLVIDGKMPDENRSAAGAE